MIRSKWYAANKHKAKAQHAKWRAANKERIKVINAKWLAENKEKARSTAARYRAAHKEQRKLNARKSYEANKEKVNARAAKWQAAHPDKVKAADAKWQAAHPEIMRIRCHNRRAKQRDNGGRLSKGITERLFKLQRGKCPCCGRPLGDTFHIDHIIPLALGGPNTDDNVQLLTAKCNNQKQAKHPIDFMRSRGFLL